MIGNQISLVGKFRVLRLIFDEIFFLLMKPGSEWESRCFAFCFCFYGSTESSE